MKKWTKNNMLYFKLSVHFDRPYIVHELFTSNKKDGKGSSKDSKFLWKSPKLDKFLQLSFPPYQY